MKIVAILTLLVFLPVAVLAHENIEDLYDEAKGFLGEGVGQEIPDPLGRILKNERANIYVTETSIVMGIVIEDKIVTDIRDGEIEDPTVKITINKQGLEQFVAEEITPRQMFEKGHIKIQGVGVFNSMKFALLNILAKIALLFT